jgi:hypothetical protein
MHLGLLLELLLLPRRLVLLLLVLPRLQQLRWDNLPPLPTMPLCVPSRAVELKGTCSCS